MSEYDDLTAEMKSRVVLPQHVYPALSIGKSAHSGELQASVRLYQSKKDVHHVPYSSAVFTSPAVGIPMFAGQLPACSIVTYRVSAPQCLVITWSDYLVELRSEFTKWSNTDRILWQAQVSDQILDSNVQRFVANMSLDDFLSAVSGTQPLKVKPLAQVLLWYALYSQWAKRKSLQPSFQIQVDPDCTYLENCPLKSGDWTGLIKSLLKDRFKADPPLLADSPPVHDLRNSTDASGGSREPTIPLWQSMLEPSLSSSVSDDPYIKILEDVQFYPESVVSTASKSLKALLLGHHVDSRLAGALSSVRMPAQLHTSLKMILAKQNPVVQKSLLPDITKWNDLCVQSVPSTIRPADKQSFLMKAGEILKELKDDSDCHAIVFSLLSEAPDGLDITPLEAASDFKSLRRAVALIARKAVSSLHLRMFLRALNNACALDSVHGEEHDDGISDSLVESFVAGGGHSKSEPPGKPQESAAPVASGVTSLLPEDTYEAVSVPSVKDSAVIRLHGLTSSISPARYNKAVHDIFGVHAGLTEAHTSRGFYHLTLSKATIEKVFKGEHAMEWRTQSGFNLRARSHDHLGEPYRHIGALRTREESNQVGPPAKQSNWGKGVQGKGSGAPSDYGWEYDQWYAPPAHQQSSGYYDNAGQWQWYSSSSGHGASSKDSGSGYQRPAVYVDPRNMPPAAGADHALPQFQHQRQWL